jgi:DNA-binding transcriptional MerR regulator
MQPGYARPKLSPALESVDNAPSFILGEKDLPMYIGQAAQRSGTTVKSIRHYESIGLLPAARRQGKYRIYDQHSVDLLIFIKCAQQLGFRLKELHSAFAGHQGPPLPWERAHQVIASKKQEIAERIAALSQQHAQLVEFESSLEQSRLDCPLTRL